jgi:DNA polymerase-3 subunit alpha (Gram-positive type)
MNLLFPEIDKTSFEIVASRDYCALDLETTGGDTKKDMIFEIGLVKIRNLEITETKSFLLNPGIRIPDYVQKLTHINQEELRDCPKIEEVIDEILEFIGDSIIVAHNRDFDFPFFNAILGRIGLKPLPGNAICTNLMTKFLLKDEILQSNLQHMVELFQLKHHPDHRALNDALAAAELFLFYVKDVYLTKGIRQFNDLHYPEKRHIHLNSASIPRDRFASWPPEIFKNIKHPCLLTFKMKSGMLTGCIPICNFSAEWNTLKDFFADTSFEICSIQLTGTFFRTIWLFSQKIKRIDVSSQKKALEYLLRTHAKRSKPGRHLANQKGFLIQRHLIPGQFLAFPFPMVKPPLLFVYPAHKQKFKQFLFSCKTRMESKAEAFRKSLEPEINELMSSFCDQEECYFLPIEDLEKSSHATFEKMEKNFAFRGKSSWKYPLEHL